MVFCRPIVKKCTTIIPFKVMSFNIAGHGPSRDVKRDWMTRRQAVSQLFSECDADVIALQEVQSENIETIKEHLTKHTFFKGKKTVSKNSKSEAVFNTVLWNSDIFALENSGSMYLSRTPGRWSKSYDAMEVRGATWVTLAARVNGIRFTLVSTHFDHVGAQARRRAAELLSRWASLKFRKQNVPLIIAGDFNCRPWIPPGESAEVYPKPIVSGALPDGVAVHQRFLEEGFADAYLATGQTEGLHTNTYHDFYGLNFPSVALRIDWVTYFPRDGLLRAVKSDICKTELNGIFPSDHFPINTWFEIQNRAECIN